MCVVFIYSMAIPREQEPCRALSGSGRECHGK
jgi:hypothetical protein